MKAILLSIAICTGILSAFSQSMITITAEQISIPADHYQQLDAILGGSGPISTFRVYAEIPDGMQIISLSGSSTDNTNFSISSGNTFYQHPHGGATAFDLGDPGYDELVQYDSWFTIGATDSLSGEEYDFSLVLETTPFFENFELGYDVEVDIDAIPLTEASVVVFPPYVSGQAVTTLNQGDENGRVLVGQFTSRQFVSGCMNITLFDLDQSTQDSYDQQVCFSFSPSFSVADFNQDGVVDVIDLTIIINNFGCINGCNGDLTGDDLVTIDDLMSFIYYSSLDDEFTSEGVQ